MKDYEKPSILSCKTVQEGVYAASGDAAANGTDSDNGPSCDSKYMKGVWQEPDYSQWTAGETRSYKQQFGCLGCPAYTATACGLTTHYLESGEAGSYDVDNGNRMPSWEKKGYKPDDGVTDWNM